jgi:hypothetical protein
MNGAEFPEVIPVSDFEPGLLAAELQVLRVEADTGMWEHPVIASQDGRAIDMRERSDFGPFTNRHLGADDGMSANSNAFRKSRRRIDDRCRVNVSCH